MDAKATALPLYGSDELGLICGWRFHAGRPPLLIGSLAAERVLDPVPGSFVWIHINLGHARAQPWLRAHTQLGEAFFEATTTGSRSTRIERDGDALLAVINDLTFDFSFDAGDVATLWVWVTDTLVVTGRLHPLRSVDRPRAAIKNGETLESGVELLDHLLNDQADELQEIARKTAMRLDDVEDAVLAGHHARHSAQLAALRRLMVRLLRTNDEFALVLRDIGALHVRIKLLQDEWATRVAEENNRSLFILTTVTVLALPINLVAGLMGMNVGGIPLADSPLGFWTTLAFIAVLMAVLAWLVGRRLKQRRR